jgi:uncharacterized membrane protein YkoI
MRANGILAIILTAASLVMGGEAGKAGQDQASLQPKVTIDQARATALTRAPGNVEGEKLERKHGLLVYSFDIRNTKGTISQVQVNAITGKIVRIGTKTRRKGRR